MTSRILLVFLVASAVAADDWPHWRGPQHDGVSRETDWNPRALKDGARVRWRADVGVGWSAVSVKGRAAITMGNRDDRDVVVCLDVRNGVTWWEHSYACDAGSHAGPRSTPTIDGDRVYTLSRDGDLFCLNLADGAVVWQRDIVADHGIEPPTWGLASSVRVVGERLLANVSESGAMFDKATGKTVWIGEPRNIGYSSPVVFRRGGDLRLAVFAAKALRSVDVANGRIFWSYEWTTRYDVNAADPLVLGDRIFIASGYDKGCTMLSIAGARPRPLWQNGNMRSHMNPGVHIDGAIYGFDGNGGRRNSNLHCINAATGALQWEAPTGYGALTAAGDTLIALTEQGTLFFAAADPREYREFSRADDVVRGRCWTVPVLANGCVYVRSHDGHVACVDVTR